VRLYDTVANQQRLKYSHTAPVLDCCFLDAVHTFSGGLDNALKAYDCNTGQESIVGYHEQTVRCVHMAHAAGLLVTGSWDRSVRLWDPRVPSPVSQHAQPECVYTLDTSGHTLVVGTADRHVVIWDLRQMGQPQQQRESSLKYQTRALRCSPDGQGYTLSSIEGRVAVEFLEQSTDAQKRKYAFKCHRVKEGDLEKIYPVNAISFHSKYNTFATGGSDGMVNIWDGFNRKRLMQLHRFPAAVAALAFSDDGSALAVASSEVEVAGGGDVSAKSPPDEIYVRLTSDQEVKPKQMPTGNTA